MVEDSGGSNGIIMGEFSYIIIKEDRLYLTGYEGEEKSLEIPERLNGYPVYGIRKKAFWGNKNLQKIMLPDTLEEIEDWAFAGCRALQEIHFPKKTLRIGNKIFRGCEQLCYVFFGNMEQSVARLLAGVAVRLEADYLLDAELAGSRRWYQALDARLLQKLQEPEEAALKDLVYCAEEDMLAKQEECLYRQRYEKAELAFLRILYPQEMAADVFRQLQDYLVRRTKGCETEEAWDVVLRQPQQIRYCDRLLEIGGIHSENIDLILGSLGERRIELKAHLLKCWQKQKEPEHIWEILSLDGEGLEEDI